MELENKLSFNNQYVEEPEAEDPNKKRVVTWASESQLTVTKKPVKR